MKPDALAIAKMAFNRPTVLCFVFFLLAFLFSFFYSTGMEPRASHMLDKINTILHPQTPDPASFFFSPLLKNKMLPRLTWNLQSSQVAGSADVCHYIWLEVTESVLKVLPGGLLVHAWTAIMRRSNLGCIIFMVLYLHLPSPSLRSLQLWAWKILGIASTDPKAIEGSHAFCKHKM